MVADIVSHGAELEAADHARATAALSAHHVAGGSISGATTILSILLLQVSKVTWQYVRARTRCHYTTNNKKKNQSVIKHT